ncbi:hypothetical protein ZeamMp053 (mitochondrion) [Zea mays subsp. mays]|jgi:hypothetical protein|uniref:Uncharacterized protein n=1 Tax=Zea mays TaxID=4577 RepID=Q6R9J3_MAIZE|nr:hypothetical protein ZeamMp053 [Zea mays subsp. mays]AAR91151.1 hypothetical protein [Zea mays]WEB51436.1 hypothetical protein [Zea mays]WEB51599.1 hypothetical protein [Zea mays]|eukprot:YP_588315.1 hypothetical protein ZeamMp053 (mitochondrion) [Zea mays subsp. mays]
MGVIKKRTDDTITTTGFTQIPPFALENHYKNTASYEKKKKIITHTPIMIESFHHIMKTRINDSPSRLIPTMAYHYCVFFLSLWSTVTLLSSERIVDGTRDSRRICYRALS